MANNTYVWAMQNSSGSGDTGMAGSNLPSWIPAPQYAAGLSAGTMQLAPNPGIMGGKYYPPPGGGIALTPAVPDINEKSLGLSGTLFKGSDGNYYKTDGTPAPQVNDSMVPALQSGSNTRISQSNAANAASLGSPAHLAMLAAAGIGTAGALGYMGSAAGSAGAGAGASTGADSALSGLGVTGPGYGAVLPTVSPAAAAASDAGLTGTAAETAMGLGSTAAGTGAAGATAAGAASGVSPTSGGMLTGAAGAGSSLLGGAGSSLLGAVAAPIAGSLIGGALSSAPVSGGAGQGAPAAYQPTNQAGMDASFNQNYNTIQGLLPSYYGNIQPEAQTALNSVLNDPYAAQYQTSANNLAAAGQSGYNSNTAMANSLNPANNANYQTLQGLLPSYYSQIQPRAQQSLDAVYNDPYAAQYQSAANNVAQQGQNVGNQDIGMANQIYQTAMDPQSALYARTLQQIQDQSRAANAAAGLGTSAAGVGLENQATGNFNIDWQNQQLNRQLSGAQGAGNISSQGMGVLQNTYNLPYQASVAIPQNQQAALAQYGQNAALYPAALSQQMQNQSQLSQMSGNVQNQGLGMLQSTYQAPYQASVAIPQNQQQAIGQYASNIGAYPTALGNQMNQAANYMGMGQAAQGQAYNQTYQNQQAQNQQAANIGSGIAGAYSNYQNNQVMNNMINALGANNQAYYGGGSNSSAMIPSYSTPSNANLNAYAPYSTKGY